MSLRWLTSQCVRAPAVGAPSLVGDPVDVVSGAVVDAETDFRLPSARVPLEWVRRYDTRQAARDDGLGFGFRHSLDHRLKFDVDGMTYVSPEWSEVAFPALERDGAHALRDTFVLRRLSENRYRVEAPDGPAYEFVFGSPAEPARLYYVHQGSKSIELQYDPGSPRLQRVLLGSLGLLRIDWTRDHIESVQLVESEQNRRTQLAHYEYDARGCLSRVENAYHHKLLYAYDAERRMSAKTNRRDYRFHFVYDERGRCVESRGEDGAQAVKLEYRPLERTTIVTRHDGGRWQYLYNELGSITHVIDPYQGLSAFGFDDKGRIVRELDPLGNETRVVYDERGIAVAKIDALGRRIDLPEDVSQPVGSHWQGQTPFDWEYGQSIEKPTQLPSPSTTYPAVPKQARDALQRSDPAWGGFARLQRNVQGLPVREDREDGSTRRWTFDENANVRSVVDFAGHKTGFRYRSNDHLAELVDALGQVTKFEFSPSEVMTSVTDPGGTRSDYRFDQKDRLIEVHRHGRLRERYEYDLADNLVAVYGADGAARISNTVGPRNLALARQLASGESQRFEYDDAGRLIRAEGAAGSCTFAYDVAGMRTLDARDGLGVAHERLSGEARQTIVFDRFATSYVSATNQTTTVVDPTGTAHRIHIDANGVIVREFANGWCELQQFAPQGRCLTKVLYRRGEPDRVWTRVFRYSGDGDLLERTDNRRGDTRYEYDPLHRLVAVRPEGGAEQQYAYDAGNNLVMKPGLREGQLIDPSPEAAQYYEKNAERVSHQGNRLHRANHEHFYYDDRDHVVTRAKPEAVTRYRRDSLDQLIAIDAAGLDWSAQYDPLGRRTQRSFRGQVWKTYWDTDRLAAEIFPDGRVRVYVYAGRQAIVPMMFVEYDDLLAPPSSGRRYYVVTNHLGAVELVLDDDGLTVWEAELEPYGVTTIRTGAEFHQPLRFPGHFYDRETGLHYNRFRYYDPILGRYLESDPLGTAGGYNLYAYTENPLREVDIRGLESGCPNSVECKVRKRIEEEGKPPKEQLDDNGLTVQQRKAYRDRIDSSEPGKKRTAAGDDARYERYVQGQLQRDQTPMPRDKWDPINDRAHRNRERGRQTEGDARSALSQKLGVPLGDNNAGTTTTRHGTRPDSTNETVVHEHKHFTGEGEQTVYDTEQMRSQNQMAREDGSRHVVTMSSDKPNLQGDPPQPRPSSNLQRDSNRDIYYVQPAERGPDGEVTQPAEVTHRWDNENKEWQGL